MDEYARLRHWMDSWTLMKLGSDLYLKEEKEIVFATWGDFASKQEHAFSSFACLHLQSGLEEKKR